MVAINQFPAGKDGDGAGQVENSGSSHSEWSRGMYTAMTTVLLPCYHLYCSLINVQLVQ